MREVLACSCGDSKPVTATAGPRVIEGGLPGPGLVALVLISKFRDHLPLERQAKIYQRFGVDLSPKTFVGWVERTIWKFGGGTRAHSRARNLSMSMSAWAMPRRHGALKWTRTRPPSSAWTALCAKGGRRR